MEVYEDETKGEIPGFSLRNSVVPTVVHICSACSEVFLACLLAWSCISMLAFCSGCKYPPKNENDSEE